LSRFHDSDAFMDRNVGANADPLEATMRTWQMFLALAMTACGGVEGPVLFPTNDGALGGNAGGAGKGGAIGSGGTVIGTTGSGGSAGVGAGGDGMPGLGGSSPGLGGKPGAGGIAALGGAPGFGGSSGGVTGTGGVTGVGGTGVDAGAVPVDAGSDGAEPCSPYSKSHECKSDGDCCLIFDQCYVDLYLVAKADVETAQACFQTRDKFWCTSCCPPVVDTWCQDGQCVAAAVSKSCGAPHCGRLSSQDAGSASTGKKSGLASGITLFGDTLTDAAVSTGRLNFGCNDF
jgi:hypothetical protein